MNSIQLIILLILYLTCALTFFLYMFLVVSPRKITKHVHSLFTDADFVRETTQITRDMTVEAFTASVQKVMPEPITISMIKDAILSDIESKLGGVLASTEFKIDDSTYAKLGETVTNHLHSWYMHRMKEAKKCSNEIERDVGEAVQYGAMQSSAGARDAIVTRISQQYPMVGGLIELAKMKGNGQGHQYQKQEGGY